MLLDSTQELYEKAIANFSKELQKAETTISDLQAKLHQTEKDLQDILLLTSENGTGETQALKQALLQTLETTENTLEQAKLDYELLKSTKSSQLSDLEHTLQSARKEYENAYTTYNKLTIRTPQAGTVKEIFISENDSIWEGNPLFSLIPEKANPTVEVQVNFEEYLTTLEITGVQLHGQVEKSEISSRSPIANASGMYTLTIPNPNQLPNTSTYIEVEFSLSTEFLYLPKEILEITDQHTGFLYIFSEKEVQKVPVELGHQRNEYIEIKTPLNNATQIITNRREYL
ncbi:MAG: HlyD family secretion protein [Candidatus Peribacteria bacterium]|jgi:multidrug efflux pump subunit AcrA (membrane-fusion protein)|nr:HlyD family secretion protein [Candidatus Peribacteria bacterium]